MLRLHPALRRQVLALVVELLDVEVFDIRPKIGEAPRDAPVVADDDVRARPGRVTPATSKSPAVRCASYQMFGIASSRCMSFDSSGLPDAVCAPETTQLLEPGRSAGRHRSARPQPYAADLASSCCDRARSTASSLRSLWAQPRQLFCFGVAAGCSSSSSSGVSSPGASFSIELRRNRRMIAPRRVDEQIGRSAPDRASPGSSPSPACLCRASD